MKDAQKVQEAHGVTQDPPGQTRNEYFQHATSDGQPNESVRVGRSFAPKSCLSLFVGFLWLAPAITLLVLNFKEYIIGAGLGCRDSECRIDPYSTNQVQEAQKLDQKNHNILGALQFVAKALEVWFMFIAGNLVYNIALWLATKDQLPMSLLTTYAEFLDLLYLKSLVTILLKIRGERTRAPGELILPDRPENADALDATPTANQGNPLAHNTEDTKGQHCILYAFIALVAFLSLVANLMGVATAVLVLPTLNWIDINRNDNVAFSGLNSSHPPRDEVIAPGCTNDNFTSGSYSCSFRLYGASLDELMDGAVSSNNQAISRQAHVIPSLIQEGNVTSSLNISESSRTIWVPTRQTLRDFSTDLSDYYFATTYNATTDPRYQDSKLFNQALQARLQRKGPVIGMTNDCVRGNKTDFLIGDNRNVSCFPRAQDIKCVPWGPGWQDTDQAVANFIINDISNETSGLEVSVWATSQAAYISKEVYNHCTANTCDWDALLSAPPIPENKNISGSQLSFEYSIPDSFDHRIVCHLASYLSFADYVLNPSPLSNILSLIELHVLNDSPSSPPTDDNSPILNINPDWVLLAWSADSSGYVWGDRSSSVQLVNASKLWLYYGDDSPNGSEGNRRFSIGFTSLHQYAIVQALSMVTYTTSTTDTSAAREAQIQREKNNPRTEATLYSYSSVQLWKYGTDSRTSKLGITIMLIGCLCVLARAAIYYDESKSPTEIVVTALLHAVPVNEVNKETGTPMRVNYGHNRAISFSPPTSPMQSPGIA